MEEFTSLDTIKDVHTCYILFICSTKNRVGFPWLRADDVLINLYNLVLISFGVLSL
jgi:hypothetical protein